MLVLLSPAKKQAFGLDPYPEIATDRQFASETEQLVSVLKKQSPAALMKLMGISEDLAILNHRRYQAFTNVVQEGSCALFSFQGDVYRSMGIEDWDQETCLYAQEHLRILSGLYGLLRPMDRIQPYRLEMKTPLSGLDFNNLYQFWGDKITKSLNDAAKGRVVLHLASEEYAKAALTKAINVSLVQPVFKQERGGSLRTMGVMAKRARGAMAGWIMTHRIDVVEEIKSFQGLGYQYRSDLSEDHTWVFVSKD
jgi:cytoplasmic iron level regulating protein YaaA (DUF328/UPF0246 family)